VFIRKKFNTVGQEELILILPVNRWNPIWKHEFQNNVHTLERQWDFVYIPHRPMYQHANTAVFLHN
jgi:hypothetical protein